MGKYMKLFNTRFIPIKYALCIALSIIYSENTYANTSKNTKSNKTNILQLYLKQERSKAGLSSKTIKVGDILWTYNEGGDTSKPSVLLIHGLAGTRDHWNKVAHYLTPHYHVIAPDLPTNGDTSVPDNFDTSIPNITSELRNFAQTIKIDQDLNIAGHSFGGPIATVYASQYPFDTQSLFLLSSAGIYKQASTSYAKNPETLKNLLVYKQGDFNNAIYKLMTNPPNIASELKLAQEQIMMSKSSKTKQAIDQIVKLNRIYTPDTFAQLTRNVEAPTLIMWGKQDQIINYEVANELQTLLKRAEKPIILNNVGHMPIIEAEKLVAQHYLPFLSKTQNLKNPLADKLIPFN